MSTSSIAGPGIWDLRLVRMDDSVEPVITEVWRLECRDPATWVQSIPLYLKFLNHNHLTTWLARTFFSDIRETHKNWFEGKVDSEIAGHVIHDLYALARRHDSGSSPWFYSSYFGPQTQLIEVLDESGYRLFPLTTDEVTRERMQEEENELQPQLVCGSELFWELLACSRDYMTGPIEAVILETEAGYWKRIRGAWKQLDLDGKGLQGLTGTIIDQELAEEFLVEFDKGGMTVEVADSFQIVNEKNK